MGMRETEWEEGSFQVFGLGDCIVTPSTEGYPELASVWGQVRGFVGS